MRFPLTMIRMISGIIVFCVIDMILRNVKNQIISLMEVRISHT